MRPRFIGIIAALAMTLAIAAPVAADAPNACPAPAEGDFKDASTAANESGTFTVDGVEVTYTVSADGKSITFSHAVSFCVKGGSDDNSGVISGTTYTVDFLNHGGNNPAISNFTVYGLAPVAVTAAAASITPPSCTAAGTLVIPADTASVMYSVSPAYAAGASGTFTVTATAKAGFVLSGTSQWTLAVAPRVTGASCITGDGTLPGNPPTPPSQVATPVRQGTLGSTTLPNTAMDGSPISSAPVVLLALMGLGGLAVVAQRNIAATKRRG